MTSNANAKAETKPDPNRPDPASFANVQVINGIDFSSVDDLEDILGAQAGLFFNPMSTREAILDSGVAMSILSRIAIFISLFGPNPDRAKKRIYSRTKKNSDKRETLMDYVYELANALQDLLDGSGIRGTQFQACFPDLIYYSRKHLISKGWVPQQFVGKEILPVIYQFGGAGPIIPRDNVTTINGYLSFVERFSIVVSEGTRTVDWNIVAQSLSWVIKIDVNKSNFDSTDTKFSTDKDVKLKAVGSIIRAPDHMKKKRGEAATEEYDSDELKELDEDDEGSDEEDKKKKKKEKEKTKPKKRTGKSADKKEASDKPEKDAREEPLKVNLNMMASLFLNTIDKIDPIMPMIPINAKLYIGMDAKQTKGPTADQKKSLSMYLALIAKEKNRPFEEVIQRFMESSSPAKEAYFVTVKKEKNG